MKNAPKLPLIAFAIAAVSLSACTKTTADDTPIGASDDTSAVAQDSARADDLRDAFENATTEPATAATAVQTFGVQLYHDLQKRSASEQNLAISPWSVESALMMTAAGAKGDTLAQLMSGLGFITFADSPASMHTSFAALNRQLIEHALEDGESGDDDDDYIFSVANAVWVAEHLRQDLRPEYQATLRDIHGAEITSAPFRENPEGARETINEWVEEKTDDKIEDLIGEGIITRDTSLVLTNAIAFDADWHVPFKEEQTRDVPFHPLAGDPHDVDMMHQNLERARYWEGQGFVGVELLYEDERYAMSVVVPQEGQFSQVRDQLFADDGYSRIFPATADRSFERVNVALPKFKFSWSGTLADTLKAMGIEHAFDNRADFSRMFIDGDERISEVIHEVYIEVDEEGTEAAAATAVVMTRTSAVIHQDPPKEVRADRPFLFVIHDTATSTPVFMGQVIVPSATR